MMDLKSFTFVALVFFFKDKTNKSFVPSITIPLEELLQKPNKVIIGNIPVFLEEDHGKLLDQET